MKKALALVLALVLALSMAVSAFALDLVMLEDQTPDPAKKTPIVVLDATEGDTFLHVYEGGTYYIALADKPWEDVKVTTNGNVTAELIDFDPETMVLYEYDENDELVLADVFFKITRKGEDFATGLEYEYAKAYCEDLKANGHPDFEEEGEVTYYEVKPQTNVNVIKVVVEDNYTAHYTEGSIVIEAKLGKVPYKGEIVVINDVIVFEYEEVKWTANNFDDDAALYAGWEDEKGYSDWFTDEHGYSEWFDDYDVDDMRDWPFAAVVSTTAFRAIEGKDLLVYAVNGTWLDKDEDHNIVVSVALYDIAKGQKGVNFYGDFDYDFVDENKDDEFDYDKENLTALEFGFFSEQVVKGDFEITFETGLDWYELRELFGEKVEEDDIISYYVVDENGKVVGGKEVDYMTADISEEAAFTIKGSNQKLGWYKLVLEVPAAEEGEANPNTGAEAVVGVVAALAVVSVATAAAVSLKK